MHSAAKLGQPSDSRKTANYDPKVEAESVAYRNSEGLLCIPHLAIYGTMRKVATNFKAKGKGKKTLKDFVYSGLQVNPEMIPLNEQEYTIDASPVVIQRSRVLRWRPRFNKWSCSFEITIVDPRVWSDVQVRDLLEDAGRYAGLLDSRPLYGLFEIEKITDAKTGKEIR